jgi:uncharacterized Tic20 family protein
VTEQPPPYGQPYGPPEGQYDPRWGYGPPGVTYGPPYGPPRNDDNTWALFAYIGMLFASFIAPLVIYLVKMRESPFIRYHAAQALNFQITMLIHLLVMAAISVTSMIVTDYPWFLVALFIPYLELVFGQWAFIILGAVKAGKGEYVRFPGFFCFRMIR